jgi:hypothetical protein
MGPHMVRGARQVSGFCFLRLLDSVHEGSVLMA